MSKASKLQRRIANSVAEREPNAPVTEAKPKGAPQVPEMIGGIEPLPLPPRASLVRRMA